MSVKSALNYSMANLGVKITHLGPLGPNYSEREWIKWLNYIPLFQQQRIDYLSEKKIKELTDDEIKELRSLRKELKMRTISTNYKDEETNAEDRIEYINYTTQKNLDLLIRNKLTVEEYKSAKTRIYEIQDTLSYEELEHYCESQKKDFDSLSMVDLFILREVNRLFLIRANEKTGKNLACALEKNEVMRQKSLIEASKHTVL